MELIFKGGCNEVGGSSLLLESQGGSVMLDCGFNIGNGTHPMFTDAELETVNSILISHAHLDHSGYLPHLFMARMYKCHMTKPTKDLMALLLADFQRLQKIREVTEAAPRFTPNAIAAILANTTCHEFNEPWKVGEGNAPTSAFNISLHNAGHILGSAIIKANDLLYACDINCRATKLLNHCEPVAAKTLVMESTYGGREDVLPSYKESTQQLVAKINEAHAAGGCVMIPVFAVGKGQEILLILESIMRSKVIPEMPIYVDGMVKKATRIYRQNAIYTRMEIQRRILMSEDDPFSSKFFKVSESRERLDVKRPCIIVSTSGMMNGGPILTYLRMFAGDPDSKLIIAGYQADGTIGRKILEGIREIEIDGERVEIKCEVSMIHFSSHADRNDLVRFANTVKGLEKVYLVHGEPQKTSELKEELEKKFDVVVPNAGERFKL